MAQYHIQRNGLEIPVEANSIEEAASASGSSVIEPTGI